MDREQLAMRCSWALVLWLILSVSVLAKGRASVSGAEVTGTFQSPFVGRFKGSFNEIKIVALGGGKLRVSFDLLYPYMVGKEMSANLGQAEGQATIQGDTAIFRSTDHPQSQIVLRFTEPGRMLVTQPCEGADFGFGHRVSAAGTYRKVSGAVPKFAQGKP